ncbi:hypothetical protein F5146DRAFT_1006527 [Armillaria mellea]|nr:hypothetical protein F5146DRAFT_1006527 [Armillaria mellea]
MSSSSTVDLSQSLADAVLILCYCIKVPMTAENMEPSADAWAALLKHQKGFMPEKDWFQLETEFFQVVATIDQDLIEDAVEEYNLLVAGALNCGIMAGLIESETDTAASLTPESLSSQPH